MEKQNDVKPRPRVRLTNGLRLIAGAAGIEVDEAISARLFELSDDEFNALLQRIAADLGATLRGLERPGAPSIEIQLENFQAWQSGKGAEYYRWSSDAMEALRARLMELGPGCELIPCYAMSVGVKLPNGKLLLINRRGEETKN
ncbi:hypothetical protein [Candidatus Binatus sp.]|uniref:hypothetical protein n=1 Tax=Candidatus Binatus sp. TaxID=2811406 RepID=UPI003C53A827